MARLLCCLIALAAMAAVHGGIAVQNRDVAQPEMAAYDDAQPEMPADGDAHPEMTTNDDTQPKMAADDDAHLEMAAPPDCGCSRDYTPVCANKDGVWLTYDNRCQAKCGGVREIMEDACPEHATDLETTRRKKRAAGGCCACPAERPPLRTVYYA